MKRSLIFIAVYMVVLFSCNLSSNKSNTTDNNLNKKKIFENTVQDIDGNIYKTVKIGNALWMKENLKVTHYRNGDPIPNITDSTAWIKNESGAYCNYMNDTSISKTYCRLYNWYAVNDSRNICPAGWYVPVCLDFGELSQLYGGATLSGAMLKESGLEHWNSPNPDATNESNFTALPGGHRMQGRFERLGNYAFFWTKEDYIGDEIQDCAYECSLNNEGAYFNQDWGFKNRGMSVRCIKDSVPEK